MIKKTINITLSIVLFLLPIIIIPLKFSPKHYNIPKIILLCICGLVLFICLFLKRKELKFDKIDKLIIGFIILTFISTIFSIDIKTSIIGADNRYEGLLTFICYFLIYYSSKYYFDFHNKKIKILSIIVILITSGLAIMQHYRFPIVRTIFYTDQYGSAFTSSTFGNRNFFGSFVTITMPFVMCQYMFNGKKSNLLINALVFLSLLVSLTRSAWVAFFVYSFIGLIYIIKQKNKEFFKRLAILLFTFILMFLIFISYESNFFMDKYQKTLALVKDLVNISTTNESTSNNTTNTVDNSKENSTNSTAISNNNSNTNSINTNPRIVIWKSALKIIKSHPILGSGPDTFLVELFKKHKGYLYADIYPILKAFPDKAHNEFLQIAATLGIPALILHISFMFLIFKKLLKSNLTENKINFTILLCLIGYLVQGLFNISTIGVAPVFYFLLGYANHLGDLAILKEDESK